MSEATTSVVRPLRIAHIAARLPVGGMEKVVASLQRHTRERGCEPVVWCLEALDQLGADLAAEGVPIVDFQKPEGRHPQTFLKLARAISHHRIDVVHCHDELSWFYGAIASRLVTRHVPAVVTMHGRRPDISRRHLLEQQVLARMSAAIVCVSDFLRRQLIEDVHVSPGRVRVIRNGIDVASDPPTPAERQAARDALGVKYDAFVVGTVGEHSKVKNLDMALEAMRMVVEVVPVATLVLIGDGALRQRLELRAEQLGIRAKVVFAGIRRSVPDLLAAFDVYVCSSDYEGVSLSILEAMARSCPVVATDVGGNPEVVVGGKTGLLVPKGDAGALAHNLLRVWRDTPFRESAGREGNARFRAEFGISRMAEAYAALYREVAGARA